jgi:hypothetical protein
MKWFLENAGLLSWLMASSLGGNIEQWLPDGEGGSQPASEGKEEGGEEEEEEKEVRERGSGRRKRRRSRGGGKTGAGLQGSL